MIVPNAELVKLVSPLAAPGSALESLNPGLAAFPGYVAGQAISSVVSPDNKTMLVLTSGFNRVNGTNGKPIPEASNEYVFVYGISTHTANKKQVLQVPNTFAGIAFSPDGRRFFVSGGRTTTCILTRSAAPKFGKKTASRLS